MPVSGDNALPNNIGTLQTLILSERIFMIPNLVKRLLYWLSLKLIQVTRDSDINPCKNQILCNQLNEPTNHPSY